MKGNKIQTDKTRKKMNVVELLSMKQKQDKICVLTAYDYTTASICDRAGIDVILVGDSAGMVMLGYPNTIYVSVEDMLLFCRAVSRGTKNAMVVGDMPFGSYQSGPKDAIKNAIRFIKAGCDAIKLEGGSEMAGIIKSIVDTGIPVMGHIGLKPQTSALWEGYRVQGKTSISAAKLISDAKALQEAGVFSIVLEMVSSEVAEIISKKITVPTIGIGSGPLCDGQVLVIHDMLGIYEDIKPKFVKRYNNLSDLIYSSILNYAGDVRSGRFPEEQNTFHMDKDEYNKLFKKIGVQNR